MQTDFYPLLETLYKGESLSQDQSQILFTQVLNGELDSINLSALLIALKMKGESSDEIAGAAEAMRNAALRFPRPSYAFSDLVGTGGDGHNTINISSAASIVAASCGIKVAKHGNRSVSSKSGSSDLFAGFGMKLDMSPEVARACLDKANFCFLAAPSYHTGMKHVMPVRTVLKTRTLFNVLGPLANPAQPTHGIYGVYTPELLAPYAQTLLNLGHNKALVVHGSGLDEIALHGDTQAILVNDGKLSSMVISPSDFGIEPQPLAAIKGDTPEFNVAAIEKVLSGKGELAHTHAIAMNAAALMWLHKPELSLKDCFKEVMQSINSALPIATIRLAAKISQGESV